MIFVGWGKDLKKIAYAGIEKCANCKNHGHFWICEQSSKATLYFVKVAKWNKKQFFMCEKCKRGWEIPEEKQAELLKMTVGLPTIEDCTQIFTQLTLAYNGAEAANRGKEEAEKMESIRISVTEKITELEKTFQGDYVEYVVSRFLPYVNDRDCAN